MEQDAFSQFDDYLFVSDIVLVPLGQDRVQAYPLVSIRGGGQNGIMGRETGAKVSGAALKATQNLRARGGNDSQGAAISAAIGAFIRGAIYPLGYWFR